MFVGRRYSVKGGLIYGVLRSSGMTVPGQCTGLDGRWRFAADDCIDWMFRQQAIAADVADCTQALAKSCLEWRREFSRFGLDDEVEDFDPSWISGFEAFGYVDMGCQTLLVRGQSQRFQGRKDIVAVPGRLVELLFPDAVGEMIEIFVRRLEDDHDAAGRQHVHGVAELGPDMLEIVQAVHQMNHIESDVRPIVLESPGKDVHGKTPFG